MSWIELHKAGTSGSGKVLINTDTVYALEQTIREEKVTGKKFTTTEIIGHGFYPAVAETYEEVKAILQALE